jgi:hypothetical protein
VKRSLAIVAVTTLMTALLAGCGGDDGGSAGGGDYCDSIADAKAELEDIQGGDIGGFEQAIETVHELADEAPDEVADDWEVLEGGIDDLVAALEKAGIEPSDLEAISRGEMPPGLDPAKLQTLAEDMQDFGGEEFETATDNIEKHAKDECDVDLSETAS